MSAEPRDLRFRAIEEFEVKFADRVIELVVTPYESEAQVVIKGRPVTEIFSRGAYDGIERRANRVKANRDHDRTRTVGGAIAFHPSREEGLVAELKISNTPLGNETLELARDGWLDASAGYRPMDGGETWESRDRVRITRAWLGHIALTPDPAYDMARVLSTRENTVDGLTCVPEQPAGTPNLDRAREWLLENRARRLEHAIAQH